MHLQEKIQRKKKKMVYVEFQDVSFQGIGFWPSVQTSSQNESLGAQTLLSIFCLVPHWY